MSEETKRQEEPFVTDEKPVRSGERPSEPQPVAGDRGRSARQAGYVAAVIVNLVLLYVFHNLRQWGVSFLTEDWDEVLPYMDASIWGTIAANVAWIFYDMRWFRRLAQIGLNVLGFRVVWAMYTIFPFEFELYPIEQAVRIGLLVALVGIGIGTVVEIVSLLFGKNHD
jgi:hypothetical protein